MSTVSSSDSQTSSNPMMSSNPMISSNNSSTTPAPQPNNQTKKRFKPGKLIKQFGKSIPDGTKKFLNKISDTYIRGSDKFTKYKNLLPLRLGKTYKNVEAERKSYKSRNALRMNTRDKKMECKKYINKVKTELNSLGNKLFTLIDTTKEDVQFDPELPELEGDISNILFIKTEFEVSPAHMTTGNISEDIEVTELARNYAEDRKLEPPYYNKISVNPVFRDLNLEDIKELLSSSPEDFVYDPEDDGDDPDDVDGDMSSVTSSVVSSSPSSVASSPSSVSPQVNVTTPLLNSNPGPNPNGYGASNSTGSNSTASNSTGSNSTASNSTGSNSTGSVNSYATIEGGGRNDDAIMAHKIIPFIKKLHDLTIKQTEDNEYINAEKMADQLTQWNRLIAINKVYVNMEKNPFAGGKKRKRRKTKKRKGRK